MTLIISLAVSLPIIVLASLSLISSLVAIRYNKRGTALYVLSNAVYETCECSHPFAMHSFYGWTRSECHGDTPTDHYDDGCKCIAYRTNEEVGASIRAMADANRARAIRWAKIDPVKHALVRWAGWNW